ncbi:MAG: demethylmenaquinone methyltransferase/2-methoxy-6-polyprenyl-1,4-benzoquinol methylase, partial [Candidatus Omnitrophota bacterium]
MTTESELHIKKSDSWQMFNTISPKYDLLNRLLSFGLDIHWRNVLSSKLISRPDMKVLDLATGTGDVVITFTQDHKNIKEAHGVDMAEKMLEVGRLKINKLNLADKITLHHGDANKIPFDENTFDNASISFGIRNVEDPSVVLRDMKRVLNQGGRAFILEFSMPENPVIRFFHTMYLRHAVPLIGLIFSGHYKAYKYLNQTIETFPYGDAFVKLIEEAGFSNVRAIPLLFGTAT